MVSPSGLWRENYATIWSQQQVFIGDARHAAQPKRSKHVYKGPTQQLINTPEDFEGYTITPGFYDPECYFCAHKLKNK